ncbi:hypothetical protein BDR26DRAFT_934051 [Obelidium mucronatum]|nr:hypothetical protein BDR26DRAFT_934051 [Obelidium mucronatum]
MADFTQICMTCEKNLQHDGIYCSMNCLRTDFGIIPSTTTATSKTRDELGWINARNSHRKTSPYLPATIFASEPILECPPSPTLSASSSSDSSVYSRKSSTVSSSLSRSSTTSDIADITQSILAPTFSLEFKSRPRRRF